MIINKIGEKVNANIVTDIVFHDLCERVVFGIYTFVLQIFYFLEVIHKLGPTKFYDLRPPFYPSFHC